MSICQRMKFDVGMFAYMLAYNCTHGSIYACMVAYMHLCRHICICEHICIHYSI